MRNIVIDLGNLEYIYSDTINAFIATNRQMLEVSGRIAILSEHPKVQDILKRAGLDNIMRIYRSEAEMVADSKEILRQTSSYRIEELQKISNQDFQAPPQEPKSEFDDFRDEMGEQLGSKIENNEYPDYQYGGQPSNPPLQPPPQPPPQAGNFEYPTVQLPIGQYGDMARGNPGVDPESEDNRQRRSPNDRLRSPNARKEQGRRVGGRNDIPETQPFQYPDESQFQRPQAPEPAMPVYSEPAYSTPQQPPQQPYQGQGYGGEPYMPTGSQPVLMEEKSFPWKGMLFIFFFLVAGGGLIYYINQRVGELPQTRSVEEPPVPPPTLESVPAQTAEPERVPDLSAPAATPPVVEAPRATAPAPAPRERVEKAPPKPRETPPQREARVTPAPAPTPARAPTATPPSSGSSTIRITSDPSGAEVLVNFSKKGETPLDVELINNSNKIIVRKAGFEKFETTLSKSTTERELRVELGKESGDPEPEFVQPVRSADPTPAPTPPPPVAVQRPAPVAPAPTATPPPPAPAPEPPAVRRPDPPPAPPAAAPFTPGSGPPGEIFLSSSPARADIYVNGKNIGKKTPAKLDLPSGSHQIRMVKDGQSASVEHRVDVGKNRALHLSLQ